MKALFICRGAKTEFMLHLAQELRAGGELEAAFAFVAYYDTAYTWLESAQDVRFEAVFGTNDIFRRLLSAKLDDDELKRIERTYGDDEIWNMVFSEWMLVPHTHSRYVGYGGYDRQRVLLYTQVCFQYFEEILEKNDIDCVIDFARVCLFRGVLDSVARSRGIAYYYPFTALLSDLERGDRFFINRRVRENYAFLGARYEALLRDGADFKKGWEYLDRFRSISKGSVYGSWAGNPEKLLRADGGSSRKCTPRIVREGVQAARGLAKEMWVHAKTCLKPELRFNFQLHKGLVSTKWCRALIEWPRKIHARHFVRYRFPPGHMRFAFMTLHLQPEASTSVLAPFQVNQLAVIENIARCLPLHWHLVVKPNKRMIGCDTIGFLRQLSRIPNVLLVDHFSDTRSLIERSRCVVTITGTSGFEAALLGKRVILLGDKLVPWHHLKSVIHVTDWRKLFRAFRSIGDFTCDDRWLAAYLQAVHEKSFAMDKAYAWEGPYDMTDEGYRQGIQAIVKNLLAVHNAS